jgi:hypothetical protein
MRIIKFFAVFPFLIILMGCPKGKYTETCILKNIVVRNGLQAIPATANLNLGDTLWIQAAVHRRAPDNNNQIVDLENRSMQTFIQVSSQADGTSDYARFEDYVWVMRIGKLEKNEMNGIFLRSRLEYAAIGDSMKIRAGLVMRKRKVYGLALNNEYSYTGFATGVPFYWTGACAQGILVDSFANPNRNWSLLIPGTTTNWPNAYYVKIN